MNVILGDPSWHSLARRGEAERRFDAHVVRAFYGDIETPVTNSWDVRNAGIRLLGTEDGFTRAMLIGTTGAGKTSLLRHLIGSHPVHVRIAHHDIGYRGDHLRRLDVQSHRYLFQ
jgi:hypothetical protein